MTGSSQLPVEEAAPRTDRAFQLLILVVVCAFVVRAVTLAWSEAPGNPPDERTHLQAIELFSHGLFAANENDDPPVAVARITPHGPYAYY